MRRGSIVRPILALLVGAAIVAIVVIWLTERRVDAPTGGEPPSGNTISALAATDPETVGVGDVFSIVPTDPDAEICHPVSIYSIDGEFVGRLDSLGFFTPLVPGATTTAPHCDSTSPVTYRATEAIPSGPLVACLSDRRQPTGCTRFEIAGG